MLLDAGMVTRLSETDRKNMLKLFQSLCGLDGRGVAKAVLSFSGQSPTCTDSCNADDCSFETSNRRLPLWTEIPVVMPNDLDFSFSSCSVLVT